MEPHRTSSHYNPLKKTLTIELYAVKKRLLLFNHHKLDMQ